VDIPGTFSAYNHIYTENLRSGRKEYLQCTGFRKVSTAASKCIGCGKCERHCPQGIPIRRELKNAASELEDFKYKAIRKAIDLFKVFG
jgi:predicted aldo/keto reductase-like oxidoreductase